MRRSARCTTACSRSSAGIITYHGHFHVKKGEGLVREIEADAVIYQELGDLTGAVLEGQSRIKSMCTACFSGEYPTGDITTGRLMQIENERLTAGK